jgi:hypothetical protein
MHSSIATSTNSPLDGRVEISNVVQDEPGQLLVLFLPDMSDKALTGQLLTHLVSGQPVLGEPVIESVDGLGGRVAGELFLDLGEVGTADKGDDAFFTEILEELDHLGFSGLREGSTGGMRRLRRIPVSKRNWDNRGRDPSPSSPA